MRIYLLSLFTFFIVQGFSQNSLYEYKVTSVSGTEIDFNNYRGKLILIVNIASGSDRNVQMQELDSLCRLYAGRGLIVIAFPSNDFGHEPNSNAQINNLSGGLQSNFLIAAKTNVKGVNISPLFRWLTQKQYNGNLDTEVKNDFQKVIVNREGKIVAVYSGRVKPFDISVINVITAN